MGAAPRVGRAAGRSGAFLVAVTREWFRKRTLGELPAEAARRWPEREALWFEGRRWTWREFDAEVDRVAKGLIGLGVEAGEHVGIWMTNRPEWLFLMFAVPKVGGVTVGLN